MDHENGQHDHDVAYYDNDAMTTRSWFSQLMQWQTIIFAYKYKQSNAYYLP